MAQSKPPKVDYDALFKDFVTHRFQDFLAFAIPELHALVDWQQPPEFLEQELINALRGKYKEKGKRRHTDKLVKVSLLSGEARLVYIHVEFQHQPETNFARRMFEYMLRIILKYNTYDIEAVAVFTGEPPPASVLIYEHKGFRMKSVYEFASIIAIHQDEAALIDSKNSFALALLAAKYAYEAQGDQGRLFGLKRKVLELCLKSGVDKDVVMKTFIFVKEFMVLSEKRERLLELELEEFMGTTTLPQIKVSEGTKRFAERIYAAAHEGKLPSEVMEEERKHAQEEAARQLEAERQRAQEEAARQLEAERQRAQEEAARQLEAERQRAQEEAARQLEAERQRAQEEAARQLEAERQRAQEEAARQLEAERQRAQEEAARQLEETILRMSKQLALPTAQIATALDVSIEVVEEVLLRQLGMDAM